MLNLHLAVPLFMMCIQVLVAFSCYRSIRRATTVLYKSYSVYVFRPDKRFQTRGWCKYQKQSSQKLVCTMVDCSNNTYMFYHNDEISMLVTVIMFIS